MQKMLFMWRGAAVLVVLLSLGFGLSARAQQAPAPTTMDQFYRLEQFRGAALNPAATHLAYVREVEGRWNLVVMEVATRKLTNVAGYDNADVASFSWLDDERLLYSVIDVRVGLGDNDKYGVFAVDRDGTKRFTLSVGLVAYGGGLVSRDRGLPTRARFVSRVRSGESSDLIAIEFFESPFRSRLLRINTRNGLRTPINADGLDNVVGWALDKNDVARAVVTQDQERGTTWVRESADAPWRKVSEFNVFDQDGLVPVRIDSAGTLYVAARLNGRDASAIHRFDWAKGAPDPEPLVGVKDFDIDSGLVFDERGDTLIGARYHAQTRGTHWFDKTWKNHQETVDKALAGRLNMLAGRVDSHILVRSSADTSPPRYFLYDVKAGKLSLLGAGRPWIDDKQQAKSDFIRYTARDGLSIPALLTLPRGADGKKKLPLVVLAHGGPYVRGLDWEWEPQRQFLASRGYAVLEPDFRGSTGHGWKHHRAGWKQWGLTMQDDLADGVKDLAQRGIVDASRVCIAGASYGGYAVVMGLIKHPDVYKCGISWVGVTDIELMFTVGWSDTAGTPESRLWMETLIGDPSKDAEQFRATSAIAQAHRLKQPLILAYGLSDVRVPYDHGQKLRDALKPHNKSVEYIEYAGEGHGWRLLETNVDFWTRAEKLLANTIGK